jgi:hypothetical protein
VTPARRRAIALVSSACLASRALSPATALAQPSAEADALIERGIQLREKGHDDQALVEFRHAYALSPSPRARAQMALAEQAVGSWVAAEEHLREALSAESDPWIAGRRAILTTAAAAIARHLGSLVVTGPPESGARVLLDGVDVGPLPLDHPVRVEIGSRLVEVRAPGFYPVVRSVEVGPGMIARETVNLVRGGEAPPTTSAASNEEKLSEGGTPGPGAFHAAFYPGGPPVGVWTLRDDKDAVLCKLPCAYWLLGTKKYSLVRASLIQNEADLRLTPTTAFLEGAYVREQIKAPAGSRIGGVLLGVGGLALVTLGAVLYATAPTPSLANGETGYEQAYLGVVVMVVGGFATAGGIATFALSTGWNVDARVTGRPSAEGPRLRFTDHGLTLAAGGTTSWLTPSGLHGTF